MVEIVEQALEQSWSIVGTNADANMVWRIRHRFLNLRLPQASVRTVKTLFAVLCSSVVTANSGKETSFSVAEPTLFSGVSAAAADRNHLCAVLRMPISIRG